MLSECSCSVLVAVLHLHKAALWLCVGLSRGDHGEDLVAVDEVEVLTVRKQAAYSTMSFSSTVACSFEPSPPTVPLFSP